MKSSNYPEINHEIIFIKRENEIIFASTDGQEIASIKVCTMEKDEKQENGKYKRMPTKSFWLTFNTVKKFHDGGLPNCASVMID